MSGCGQKKKNKPQNIQNEQKSHSPSQMFHAKCCLKAACLTFQKRPLKCSLTQKPYALRCSLYHARCHWWETPRPCGTCSLSGSVGRFRAFSQSPLLLYRSRKHITPHTENKSDPFRLQSGFLDLLSTPGRRFGTWFGGTTPVAPMEQRSCRGFSGLKHFRTAP